MQACQHLGRQWRQAQPGLHRCLTAMSTATWSSAEEAGLDWSMQPRQLTISPASRSATAQYDQRSCTRLGQFSTQATAASISSQVDTINDLFVLARDEIETATEEAETVYFNESVDAAVKAVDDVLNRWNALLAQLPEDERSKMQRSMGLKMAQLTAELDRLKATHS